MLIDNGRSGRRCSWPAVFLGTAVVAALRRHDEVNSPRRKHRGMVNLPRHKMTGALFPQGMWAE
jgi:hypothetical protein